jgi:hypothetical protein
LQNVLDRVPETDVTVILGDLNAQLEKEPLYSEVTGKYTIYDEKNRKNV